MQNTIDVLIVGISCTYRGAALVALLVNTCRFIDHRGYKATEIHGNRMKFLSNTPPLSNRNHQSSSEFAVAPPPAGVGQSLSYRSSNIYISSVCWIKKCCINFLENVG
jgi:hypothetical protein